MRVRLLTCDLALARKQMHVDTFVMERWGGWWVYVGPFSLTADLGSSVRLAALAAIALVGFPGDID